MTTESSQPPVVMNAKHKLQEGRARIHLMHNSGGLGVHVSRQIAQLFDDVVLDIYQGALAELWETSGTSLVGQVALVAHGGHGRCDVAPYSDLDIMLLHNAKSDDYLTPLVRKFTHAIFDTGMQLGFSVRTTQQACELARNDATILTALAESRLLHGEESIFRKFMEKLRRETKRNATQVVEMIVKERSDERAKFGETVYMLEPNLKRSRGGLRDIQLLRWLGFTQHGETDWESLRQQGMFTPVEAREIRDAHEFLLRLRNELHFHSQKAQDVLDRAEQLRIAEKFGYREAPGLLAVEQFMRVYFHHTENINEISEHAITKCRPRTLLRSFVEPLLSHLVENDFRVGPASIWATAPGLEKLRGNVGEMLRLMEFAALYDKPIAQETLDAMRSTSQEWIDQAPPPQLTLEIRERFLRLLEQPARLAETLRHLHRLHLLEQIIPAVRHARSLLQFNNYHKFTVDEHTLRAMEIITGYHRDPGAVGDAYRAVKHKRALHLAMLLHDLGKGFEEDHSDVGQRIAVEAAARLHLPEEEASLVEFLVHKHLRMAIIAQRHDIHDDRVVAPFAAEVGSPETLRMLFVLTCADITAVGPGTMNDWKFELLNDLYKHTLHLFSENSPEEATDNRLRQRRQLILKAAESQGDQDWYQRIIEALPAAVLLSAEPEQIVAELARLQALKPREVQAWGRFLPERNAVEYTVGTYDGITPGIFHKLTGALSSSGQQILSAEIHTLSDTLVLDRFYVEDRDYTGAPPAARITQMCQILQSALEDQSGKHPTFRRIWSSGASKAPAQLLMAPTQIIPENDTSDQYTIISIFTHDRMGLLYTIALTLFEEGLSIARAKIGTHLDQVVDVFYVTDANTGKKINDSQRIETVKDKLLENLQKLETSS
jgi:[protein-PII] uridylyltransferase